MDRYSYERLETGKPISLILPLSLIHVSICVCVCVCARVCACVRVYSIETYKLISCMQRKIFNKRRKVPTPKVFLKDKILRDLWGTRKLHMLLKW